MSKVTLTLELDYDEAITVLSLLAPEAHISTVAVQKPVPKQSVTLPSKEPVRGFKRPVTVPTAGKKTKMPSLGRSQTQIDSFTEEEQDKFDKKSEDQLLKEERAADRAERKKEKDELAKTKKEETDKAADEIKRIKDAAKDNKVIPTVIKKPWEI